MTRPILLGALLGLVALMPLYPAADDTRRDLRKALAEGDAEKLDAALTALARSGGAASMKICLDLLEKMPASQDAFYWSLIGGAATFVDRDAMVELGKFLVQKKTHPLARDILFGLAKNPSPWLVLPLKPLVLDGPLEVRLLAARKIATVRSHDAVDVLLELLKKQDDQKGDLIGELGWIAVEGLTRITGQSFGPTSVNWEGWWQKNRSNPLPRGGEQEGGSRTGTAVDFLKLSPDRARREAFVGLEQAPTRGVVVLSAKYTKKLQRDLNNDHMEQILERMKIPHTIVPREDFKDFDLRETGVLLINCAQFHEFCICPTCKPGGAENNRLFQCTGCNKHENFSAQLTGEDIKKIVSFVQGGGFLFCEDWTVKEVVERAFPKFVEAGDKLQKGVVDVIPGRGQGTHPYLKGIFEPKLVDVPPELSDSKALGEEKTGTTVVVKRTPQPGEEDATAPEPVRVKHDWKIDNESFSFKIVDSARVVAFLTSGKLQKDCGNGAVALSFRPGPQNIPPGSRVVKGAHGVVTVVLSHFKEQQTNADDLSIQNLLLNVLIDANSAREARGAARAGAPPAKKKGGAPKGAGKEEGQKQVGPTG